MTKLNWRDASKELPRNESHLIPYSKYCLIILKHKDKPVSVEKDFFISDIQKWGMHNNLQVTHWIYADEIPLPNGQ